MSDSSTSPSDAAAVDDLCDRFRAALRRGDRPRVEDRVAGAGPGAPAVLVRLVLLKLDHCVRAGEPLTASDYFSRFPGLRADPAAARDLVGAEFRAARARDPGLTESTFRERYPDLADPFPSGDGSWVTIPEAGTAPFRAVPSGTPPDGPDAPPDPLAFLKALLLPPDRPADLGRLDHYRIAGVLGHGGMGVVLRGEDALLNRTVALKVMRPEVAANPLAKERFLREARAMAAVEHPRVVVVHQIGEWRGTPFLVMPLMKGCSLGQRIKHGPPVPVAEAVRFAREAAEGLAAAHARGLVHRDVKPDNLWLEETPDGVHVRVLDFGLVRDDGADPVTRAGTVFGTPSYMAPEQAAGERVDGRADLFSLGCVLYELVTGTRAFRGDTLSAVLFALANHHPPAARGRNPDVPEPLSALIDRLLAKRRDDRPGTATDLVAGLKVLEGTPAPARHERTAVWEPAAPPRRRRRARAAGVVVVAAACAGIVATLVPRTRPVESAADAPPPGEPKAPVAGPLAGQPPVALARTDAPPLVDANRSAAEWVLSLGGEVEVRVGPEPRAVAPPGRLPREPFTLFRVHLRTHALSPSELGRFRGTGLRRVYLDQCRIGDEGMAVLGTMPELVELSAGVAGVTDAGMAHLSGMRNLKIVGLCLNTGVTDRGLAFLTGSGALEQLDLNGLSGVTDAGMDHVARFPNLQWLNLHATRVTNDGLAKLSKSTSLKWLTVAALPVTDQGVIALRTLSQLETLQMENTGVGDEGLRAVAGRLRLRRLALTGTKVTDQGLVHLATARDLSALGLGRTLAGDAGVKHLAGLPLLTDLELNETRVTDAAIEDLIRMRQLTRLHLNKTRVTAQGFERLKKAFPGADLAWSPAAGP